MYASLIKRGLRCVGIDARRYDPRSSDAAKTALLLTTYGVDCVFDVGANTGQYALGLRDIGFRGRVVSFEPLDHAHALLLKNSLHDPLWEVAPRMALGDIEGSVSLHVSENLVSSSIMEMTETHRQAEPTSTYVRTEEVPIRTLDSVYPSYIRGSARPLLKIDTQGYEPQVLDGAGETLEHFVGVQAEMTLEELYSGQMLFVDFVHRMQRTGFELMGLFPGFTDRRTGRLLQVDGIFFRP
jgi:FkbM family methyltransferase